MQVGYALPFDKHDVEGHEEEHERCDGEAVEDDGDYRDEAEDVEGECLTSAFVEFSLEEGFEEYGEGEVAEVVADEEHEECDDHLQECREEVDGLVEDHFHEYGCGSEPDEGVVASAEDVVDGA